jgi:hypothetical protein
MTITISRLYDDYPTAVQVVKDLQNAGIPDKDISIVSNNAQAWPRARDDRDIRRVKHEDLRHADRDPRGESAGIGAGIGAALGGTAGLLTGLGIVAIPGLGPVVAAGWLAATALGAAAGGLTGGIIGALTGEGISESDAHVYAEGIRRGGTMVSARVSDKDRARYEAIMNVSAVNIRQRETDYRSGGWTRFDEKARPYTAAEIQRERARYHEGEHPSDADQLEALSNENAQLKRLLGEAMLENARLKDTHRP